MEILNVARISGTGLRHVAPAAQAVATEPLWDEEVGVPVDADLAKTMTAYHDRLATTMVGTFFVDPASQDCPHCGDCEQVGTDCCSTQWECQTTTGRDGTVNEGIRVCSIGVKCN